MKRKLVKNLGLLLVLALSASGCGASAAVGEKEAVLQETETAAEEASGTAETETEQTGTEETAVTFVDDLGREVTVDRPERVVTLIGSFTDTWLLAGGTVVGAANDSWSSLELDLGEDVINTGSILTPDVEQIIAAEPDFIIASANTEGDVELLETFEEAGITVAYFSVSNFDEYLHMLEICTRITGREDLYQQNGLDVQAQIEEVKERIDGSAPTVLFLRASSSSVKAKGSDGNIGGEILAGLGCVNIADDDDSLLDDLSMEAIIAADPEYIFVTTQGDDTEAALQSVEELLLTNPAWNALSAVSNGNYYVLEKRLYNLKPNAKWGQAYEQLADILYPAE